ncbi:MAG: MATE family efflux transporter, partial [Muribaculaceae bacterium]|nr:MATE family efflux transporter [Muribaculaceae bacterium]
RLDGSPKFAMYCNIIPAVINIALDYYLVFPCGMGVKGAAIATSASIAIGATMVLVYFVRFSYVIKFRWSSRGFAANCLRQIRIGSSAFITEIAMSVMMLTGNYVFMQYYGENGVAAFSIACYLFPLIFMMSNAVAQSAQPIISYNYGAGATDRVRRTFRLSLKVAALCGLLSFLGIALGARGIVAMFIPPECPAGRLATYGLPIYSFCSLFFAMNISFIGYCQSIEKAFRAMAYTLLRGVVLLVPMFLLLPRIAPDRGVWAAIPLSEASTLAIICATYLLSARKSAVFS